MRDSETDKTEKKVIFFWCVILLSALLIDGCCGERLFAVEFRRAEPTLGDVHAASCRVRVSNARGTGIFNGYNAAENIAYITTNDHVTTTNGSCKLDFWTNAIMETVDGRVVYSLRDDRASRDFAIIAVDADALKKIDPPYIPIKPLELNALQGRVFFSSGCPDGRFDQGFRGVIESTSGGMAVFSPPPVPGQSGSGICVVVDGKIYDVAKLTYLLGTKGADESKGGALPLANLLNASNIVSYEECKYSRVPVASILDDDVVKVQEGAALYTLGRDNGITVKAPGEPEKTIAVYVTDPASYDVTPEVVASRQPPRGLFQDLLRDDGVDDQPKDDDAQEATPRRKDDDARRWTPGDAITDKIEDKVTNGIYNAFSAIIPRTARIIFWLGVAATIVGLFLARGVVWLFKSGAKWLKTFIVAFKEISAKNENNRPVDN